MLSRLANDLRVSSIGLTLLVGACFNPEPTPLDTESGGTTGADTTDGGVCTPGDVAQCPCDGFTGTQICNADGSGFGTCECASSDTTTTDDPTDTTTGPLPECTEDVDCEDMAPGECFEAVCGGDGMCVVQPLREGTACGDASEGECTGADACDARGNCVTHDAPDGSACRDCPLGVCACAAGSCGDCAAFAPENNFITPRSIEGWELTGGWGLHREAPQNFSTGPAVFGNQVLGTDGNRVAPYPGTENESSHARSGPLVLPATLEFLSWNVDEGSGVDTKQVRVSIDGGASFTTLVDCTANPASQPFCQFRDDSRAPNDWDMISIPVPAPMVGQVGLVEFGYNTQDTCCGFEKGWYIDAIRFATECACVDDGSCAGLGGECGAAVCGASGECELDAVAAGTACGDAAQAECNAADACDGAGYCASNEATTGLTSCEDCPAGPGSCNACQAGACVNCIAQPATNDFSPGASAFAGWVVEDLSGNGADWRTYSAAPQNLLGGSVPVPLSFAPSFGTDGNRQTPYPGSETEHSRITTTPDVVPASLTFSSWHVDEGGGGIDNKIIEVSVDGGASWNVLVNCSGMPGGQPFCVFRNDGRLGNDWDNIVINTGAFAGQVGQLRFTYNTGDSCCDFERGWFIDNLNFAQYCSDSPFP